MWRIFLMLLLLTSSGVLAQVNLVLNGDFETYSQCPWNADQIWLAKGWMPIDTTTLYSGQHGNANCSAEYCNVCATGVACAVPQNGAGHQYARSGKGMALVLMYVPYDSSSISYYQRDYIMSLLTQKLAAGRRYCVSFYVSLAEGSIYAIKDISALFDDGAISATNYCGIAQSQYTPQITYIGSIVTDTSNWTKVEGSFIANGKEKYIVIGNFKDRTGTTNITLKSGWGNVAYYYVDDVSVVESNTKADAGPDTHVGAGDSIFIGRTDAAMDCTWTKLGSTIVIGTGAGIWVKPTVTTSYVVTQTLCGVVTKDTVRVEVWAAGVQSIKGQSQQYTIAPNPNNGAFELLQSVAKEGQASVSIINAVGQRLYSGEISFKGGRSSVDAVGLPSGIYYLSLQTKEGYVWNMRFVRE